MKPQTTKHAVVLGAGYAGVNAALRLRLRDKHVQITVINERPFFVERIRNHQLAAGQKLKTRPLAKILGHSIGFLQGRVLKLDPHGRAVMVETAEGTRMLQYDLLVYALGSGLARNTEPGVWHINAHEAATRLMAELRLHKNIAVEILGAGLTGLELATELREKFSGADITLIDDKEPGSHLAPRAKDYLQRTLHAMQIKHRARRERVAVNSTGTLTVDCTGFRPPALAKASGLACDDAGRILVDANLRAQGFGNILVAGDAAAYAFGSREIVYAGCATAMPMGTYAGEAAACLLKDKNPPVFRYGFTFQCISLGRKNGIIQFLDKHTGEPIDRMLTGKSAAIFKELISRLTVLLPRLEGMTRLPFYQWRKTRTLRRVGKLVEKAG